MSKSRGNLVFVSQLRADGSTRWRSGWPCWPTTTARTGSGRRDLLAAEERLARWRAAGLQRGPEADTVLEGVRARMTDDLDTPGALAIIDDWAERALSADGTDSRAPLLVKDIVDALLALPSRG